MKKLYHEYFRIPENGKISDKVMLGRTVVAALCVILCLCAFSVSTYAYYYMTVSSTGNNVQAATFEVEVTVMDGTTPVTAETDGSYKLSAGDYTVVLQKTGTAQKVYFLINNGGTESHTTHLSNGNVQHSFVLTVAADNTTVSITQKWGDLPGDNPIDIGTGSALLIEGPVDEEPANENEQENQQQEEEEKKETPSDEKNPADDTNTGEEEKKDPDTPADGEGNNEQQPDKPSNTAEDDSGQQSDNTSETPDVSGETTGSDTVGDDAVTGSDAPTGDGTTDNGTTGDGTTGVEVA